MSNEIEQRANREDFLIELRGNYEKNQIEHRTNHENFSNEIRVNQGEINLKRRESSENLSVKPRESREEPSDLEDTKSRESREGLSNEQLVLRIKAGENVAENMLELWQQNKGIIHQIARKYSAMAEYEDLKQEGYFGLCAAVDHWNPDKETNFMTYAIFWIRTKIGRYARENGTVRISDGTVSRLYQYKKLSHQFYQEFGRKPTDQEVCCYMDLSTGWLQCVKQAALMMTIGSLDKPIAGAEDLLMGDIVASDENLEDNVLDQVQQYQLQTVIWNAVDSLPGKQPDVIRMRYQDNKTLQAVGDSMGLTRERVRQIENKAFRTLRNKRYSDMLLPFLDEEIRSRGMSGNGVGSFNCTWTSSTEKTAFWLADR